MKAGIIGAGIISESHLQAMDQIESIDAACIADIDLGKAEKLAEKYRLKAYKDYREMIERETPDIIIISLPHFLHEEAGIFCMENGCHVLMEKPMAISTSACNHLIASSEKHKRTFFVGHIRYYFKEDRLIGDILQSGRLGNVSMINIKRYCNYFYNGRPSWFLKPSLSGGGILANIGTHEIEKVIRYGGLIRNVKASVMRHEGIEVEGIVNAIFELENGAIASIKLNGYSSYTYSEIEIMCDNGILLSTSRLPYMEIFTGKDEERLDLDDDSNPFVLQLKDFLACVKTGRKPYLSGEHGRKVVDAVERAYASAVINYSVGKL